MIIFYHILWATAIFCTFVSGICIFEDDLRDDLLGTTKGIIFLIITIFLDMLALNTLIT